jgi:putative membrane protein
MTRAGRHETDERPDYQFALANERTFLAWIRTALALLAGGVLLEQFADRLQPRAVVVALAVLLSMLSAAVCGLAYLRWRAHDAAVREGRPLSASLALPLTAAAMFAVATAIAAMIGFEWLAS